MTLKRIVILISIIITRIECRPSDTTYRCIHKGYREDATFKTYEDYCKLLIRSTEDGYIKLLFAQ